MLRAVDFKVNFFKVTTPSPNSNFGKILDFCSQWDEDADKRNHNRVPNIVRLQELIHDSGVWIGDMLWIDMTETALRADRQGDVDPVKLAQDQGIADTTAFLYDPKLNCLLLESSRPGVTKGRFRKFYSRLNRVKGEIELPTILTADAYQNMSNLNRVTKLAVKIAGGVNGQVVKDSERPVKSGLEIAEALDAPELTLEISVGRAWRNDELNRSNVMTFVKDALSLSDNDDVRFDSMEVVGRNRREEREEINLIKDKMQYEEEIQPNSDRTIPFNKRANAIENAYRDKKSDLNNLFG